MRKILYQGIINIGKILTTFFVTFLTAILASNNQNIIYIFLDNLGYTDETVKKAILSGIIVAFIGIFNALLWLFRNTFIYIIKKYFRKISIDINFKVDNRNKEKIKFVANDNGYKEINLEIEIIVTPAGKLTMWIIKAILDLKLEIFFNPKIIDITLANDKEWADEEDVITKVASGQTIQIDLLDNYRLGGSSEKPFKMVENIILVPKRVKKETTNINFGIKTMYAKSLGAAFCELSMKDLIVECEGGRNFV